MTIKLNLTKIFYTFSLLALITSQQINTKTENQVQAISRDSIAQTQGTNISFEVCFNSDTFVRPSREEYTKFIKQNDYLSYRVNSLFRNNISNLFNSPKWRANILFFDSYYGVSGGKDMELSSGIEYIIRRDKNADLGIGRCWERFAETNAYGKPISHNEVRLFNYKLKQIKWANNKYIFVVEPRNSGLQILHFRKNRQGLASGNTSPIEVVDTNGRFLGKCKYTCQLKK